MISFPLIGHIRAVGMTIPALEKELSKRLKKNYQTEPQITVTLSETGAGTGAQVFITGEVNRPGPYSITPGTSVMQAIALSGGLGRFAAKSRIQIHRKVAGSEQVLLFNYSDFESGNNLEGPNIRELIDDPLTGLLDQSIEHASRIGSAVDRTALHSPFLWHQCMTVDLVAVWDLWPRPLVALPSSPGAPASKLWY
jgi:protein involved in polysaccharide export with SLBB domain